MGLWVWMMGCSFGVSAQKTATIYGNISDSSFTPIDVATVQILNSKIIGFSDVHGNYSFSVPADSPFQIVFTYFGGQPQIHSIRALKQGEKYKLNVLMGFGRELDVAVIRDERREKPEIYINPRLPGVLPTFGDFNSILKTFSGVTSNNELSSQYNVRGGNYDENLIYVNDIEIYRPFLPRSGQQEGLSFIHPELVQNIKFSAGGFDARYGDKMSSVLDIKYKSPKAFAASTNLGLLGVQTHVEGATKNLRLTYLLGARYWTNKFVVGTLDTKGDYHPSFYDVQTLIAWHLTDNLSLSFLGSYAQNKYNFVPQDRETVFGTVNRAFQLKIYFDGADLMQYQTSTGAATLNFRPNHRTELKIIGSRFYSNENEIFTVEGAYRLSDIETDLGSDNFAHARSLRGVGYFINNARNSIVANVNNIGHRGYYSSKKNALQWGAFFQTENISDKLHEWFYDDSAGFSRPPLDSNGNFVLNSYLNTGLNLSSYRVNGYLQNSQTLNQDYNVKVTYGIRSNYWSYNKQNVVSPRVQFAFEPNARHNRLVKYDTAYRSYKYRKDWLIKAAWGFYYQPPFYRELRDFDGKLNPNIKAQRAIHYVLGSDVNFIAWHRLFKYVTEIYYKQLDNLIPYEIDNVRIRYFANNNSKGYATGIDMRVNGEFVKGVESWASLSVMKTQEMITDAKDAEGKSITPHYIPRPTDQRVTFAIFFQDYLPKNPKLRMSLNLVYGSGFPFGVPDRNRYNDINQMPSYRRGMNYVLIEEDTKERDTFWKKAIKTSWLGLEVFNLLGVNNTISYIWIQDVEGNRYAVPNYLTNRRVNIKLMARF